MEHENHKEGEMKKKSIEEMMSEMKGMMEEMMGMMKMMTGEDKGMMKKGMS